MLSCSFRWFESCAALWRVAPALVSARAVVTVVWDSSHGAVESRKTISLASSGACVCFIIGVTISTAQQLLFLGFCNSYVKTCNKIFRELRYDFNTLDLLACFVCGRVAQCWASCDIPVVRQRGISIGGYTCASIHYHK